MDLLDEISKISAFEYVMKPSNDETYGSIHHGTGEWNGIIGDLLNGVVIIVFIISLAHLSRFEF